MAKKISTKIAEKSNLWNRIVKVKRLSFFGGGRRSVGILIPDKFIETLGWNKHGDFQIMLDMLNNQVIIRPYENEKADCVITEAD